MRVSLVVHLWDSSKPPSPAEVACAMAWMRVVGATTTHQGRFARRADWVRCNQILMSARNSDVT